MWFYWGFQPGIYYHISSDRQLVGRTQPAASSTYKYTQLCSVSPLQLRLSLPLHFITLTANKVLTAAALWHTWPYPSMAALLRCIVIICGQSFGQKRQPPCFLAPQGIHWASIKSERKSASSPAGFGAAASRFLDIFPRHTKGGSPARVQVRSLLQHVHMGTKSELLVKRLWRRALGADDSDKLSRFIFIVTVLERSRSS